MSHTTRGVQLPVDDSLDSIHSKDVSLPLPPEASQKHVIAAFAIFLHRISTQHEIAIWIDTVLMKSSLTASMSCAELEKNIVPAADGDESSITLSFSQRAPDCDFGAYVDDGVMHFVYRKELFSYQTILRWSCYIEKILEIIRKSPEAVAKKVHFMTEKEQELVTVTWNRTDTPFPDDKCLFELIEEQVVKTADAEAVHFRERSMSYSELNAAANKLAHTLRALGVGPDVPVAICMERSIRLVVGLLGILKAGGAYVPMDPSYPKERLEYFLENSKAPFLLTERTLSHTFETASCQILYLDDEAFSSKASSENLPKITTPEHLAYVIYTSGSTGKPKGAANVHKGVVNRIVWMHNQYGLSSSDRVLQKTPFGFDVSVWEFFWPLMVGATLVVAEPNIHKDAEALAQLIQKERISVLHFVPSMLRIFLEADIKQLCHTVKKVFASGEALSSELQRTFFKELNTAELHNLYGPTEASIDVSYWQCMPNCQRSSVPIGRPIANTQLYILDEFLAPCPIGVPGELFIGGVGLARGYLHREDLTQERFIQHPFQTGARLYKTGDLCSFRVDGTIDYLGRIDNQLKLRGFRIELGEIEAVIRRYEDVQDAAVIAREEVAGHKYLAAYILSKRRQDTLRDELEEMVRQSLPEYMIPSAFVLLDSFPINPNGKLDIKKLPIPSRISKEAYIAPRSESEKALQRAWKSVLKQSTIGVLDHFFSIGGHSILAMELVLKIRKELSKSISLPEIFEHPTIEAQARLLEGRAISIASAQKLLQIPEEHFEPFALTDIQKAYLLGRTNAFFLGEIRSHIYVENERDWVHVERLEQAWNTLIARHDMLRCVLQEDGTQKIVQEVPYYHIEVYSGREEETRALILETAKKNNRWPLFDLRCTKTASGKWVLHFYFDLLIADGTGLDVLFKELSLLYENKNLLPSPGISYRDTLRSMDEEDEAFLRAKEYWFQRLNALPDAPELPTRFIKDATMPIKFVRRQGFLPQERWKRLQKRALELRVTPAALLATAYGEVLKTWSKSPHFTLNVMFFNRPTLHPDINRVVGNFSTTLLLEMNLGGTAPFHEKAKSVQHRLLHDLEHSACNGIKVLNELNRRQGGSRTAAMPVVFACALNIHDNGIPKADHPFRWYGNRLSYSQLETPQVWFDHQVFEDDDGSLCFFWDTRDGYFHDGVVDAMFTAYNKLLEDLCEGSKELSIVPSEDRAIITRVNSTQAPRNERCLHEDILRQAFETPEKCALITSEVSLTYGELVATAFATKEKLTACCTVATNDIVAVIMEKNWQQVAAVLAILSSQAAYVPIDRALPEERIQQILMASGSKAAILQKPLPFDLDIPVVTIDTVEQSFSTFEMPAFGSPEDLAYVIFTSGSTGTPKGVMIEHRAALNTIDAITEKHRITENDRAFAISSLSFDLSVYDVFGLLGVGGSLYIPTSDEVKAPERWLEAVQRYKITIWNSAPQLVQLLVDQAELSAHPLDLPLRLVMMSGDWIPVPLPDILRRHCRATIMSLGGATEASIWSNDYRIENVDQDWSSIPYGMPLANQTMRILDESLQERAIWATGMIYIGGKGLARGYLKDPEKTAKSFLENPTTGERLYRTGDFGRLRPDGNIEFLGREDLQVKVQGYRIELEEIEAVVRLVPQVQGALVRIIGGKNEAKRIVAFFSSDETIALSGMKGHLERHLPSYMVPQVMIRVDAFPLNSNGKVDIKALMKLVEVTHHGAETSYEPPQGDLERGMCALWEELLTTSPIGRNENFFSLGGTSFLAFQMLHRVRKELHVEIPLSMLFQKGTVKDLCAEQREDASSSLILLQEGRGNTPPLFLIHPSGGGVLCYTELAELLGQERPIYALQSPGYMNAQPLIATVEEMARFYLSLIRQQQPEGPYHIGGWSFGGVVAFQMAAELKASGQEVSPVLLIDAPAPVERTIPTKDTLWKWFTADYGTRFSELDKEMRDGLFRVFENNIRALFSYHPIPCAIELIQMKAQHQILEQLQAHSMKERKDWGWSDLCYGSIICHSFDAHHSSILERPIVTILAEKIREYAKDILLTQA